MQFSDKYGRARPFRRWSTDTCELEITRLETSSECLNNNKRISIPPQSSNFGGGEEGGWNHSVTLPAMR